MSIRRPFICLALSAVTFTAFEPSSAQAGPLIDWLFGHHQRSAPAYPVGGPVPVGTVANMPITGVPLTGVPTTGVSVPGYGMGSYVGGYGAAMPVTSVPIGGIPSAGYSVGGYPPAGFPASGYAANYGNYYGSRMPVIGPSGYGYPAVQPNGITAATAPTIMSYVPDYRTTQYRAPVTYYRPLMTTDPNTGAQVVALAPCSSYEYQTQRVPTFGYNGVLGSYSTPPVVPGPPSMPTYTLPSGGVPIAAGNAPTVLPPGSNSYSMAYGNYSNVAPTYSSPSYSSPSYSSNYGAYSPQSAAGMLQPGLTAPPSSAYPTQPMTAPQGYYGSVTGGSTGGGSTGSYLAPTYTPGLTAPQGPAPVPSLQPPTNLSPSASSPYPANSYPAPGYLPSTPTYPLTPSNSSSGDVAPVLPPNLGASNDRSQLRAIVRQPMTANNSLDSSNPLNSARTNQQAQQVPQSELRREAQSPVMDPIPVPANLDQQPRWNPGLLKDEDRTALRPVTPNYSQPAQSYAGQGKPIQWASFQGSESSLPAAKTENQLSFSTSSSRPASPTLSTPSGLRAVVTDSDERPAFQQPAAQRPTAQETARPLSSPQPAKRYTGGWNAVK